MDLSKYINALKDIPKRFGNVSYHYWDKKVSDNVVGALEEIEKNDVSSLFRKSQGVAATFYHEVPLNGAFEYVYSATIGDVEYYLYRLDIDDILTDYQYPVSVTFKSDDYAVPVIAAVGFYDFNGEQHYGFTIPFYSMSVSATDSYCTFISLYPSRDFVAYK